MLDLEILNPKQLEAVTVPMGPVLVSAGAGSGKTKILTCRIAYLIESGQVSGGKILALTFTNKAAKEMRNRVQNLLNTEFPNSKLQITNKSQISNLKFQMPTMGTFHSAGVRILREFGRSINLAKNFTIFDSDDSLRIIKKIYKELEMPESFAPSLVAHLIGQAKNQLITPEDWQPDVLRTLFEKVRSVYFKYEEELKKNNAVDFDDLLVLPIKLWQGFPEVLKICSHRFSYILVDEYQDTNLAQYEWLKILRPDGKIFAVGDDAQSIYGFRGSNLENWQHFQRDFKDTRFIHLEQNYRSTQNILDAAGKVLLSSGNDHKLLWTHSGPGDAVKVHEFNDDIGEAEFVVRSVSKLARGNEKRERLSDYEYGAEDSPEISLGGGLLDKYLSAVKMGRRGASLSLRGLNTDLDKDTLGQTAVLYRTHGQSRVLEEAFISSGIPYRIVGGLRFYQRKEVKDMLAAIRFLLNPGDFVALERIVDALPLGVGDKSLPHLADALRGSGGFDEAIRGLVASPLQARQKNGALKFFAAMSVLSSTPESASVADVLKLAMDRLEFQKLLRDGTEQGEGRWENLQELVSVAVSRLGGVGWRDGAEQLLEEAALLADAGEEGALESVQLMTIHAAKGLEFDHVFVTGWEEGVLPHSRAIFKPGELAEEIRLAYVAMTRAKKKLFLTYARGRMLGGGFKVGVPSRFLRHLPDEGVMWSGGRQRNIKMPSGEGSIVYEPMEG